MLEIQKFIKKCNDIELANHLLFSKLGITSRRQEVGLTSGRIDYLYIYNYTENSPAHNPIVNEANGLILDKDGNVVSRGLNRIYPLNDINYPINWTSAIVEEKITGTQVMVYNHKDTWIIQTKNNVIADEKLYEDDIWKIGHDIMDIFMALKNKKHGVTVGIYPFYMYPKTFCYTFIYVRPEKREPLNKGAVLYLVSLYNKEKETFSPTKEIHDLATLVGFKRPKLAFVNNQVDVDNFILQADEASSGCILYDISGVKTVFSKKDTIERSTASLRYLARAVLADKSRAISKALPNYVRLIALLTRAKLDILGSIHGTLKANEHLDAEEFAEKMVKHPLADILIGIKKGIILSGSAFERIGSERFLAIVKGRYWTEFDDALRHAKANN